MADEPEEFNEVTNQMAALLEEWFPDATAAERFKYWQEYMLELIEQGDFVALLLADGNIRYTHVEHCTDEELARRMTAEQYRLFMER